MIPPAILVSISDFQGVFVAATTLGVGGFGIYAAIKRAKKNAQDATTLAEEKTQKRITDAVAAERTRYEQHRDDEDDRIKRLREIADEWKEIATQRNIKIGELTEKVAVMDRELKSLEAKYESVLEANTMLVRRVGDLEKKLQ